MKHFYLTTLLAASLFMGCDTEVPEVDETAPTYSALISGDGKNFTVDHEHLNATINIKLNEEYTILFIPADRGGVKEARLTAPLNEAVTLINTDTKDPQVWQTQDLSTTKVFSWTGDKDNAKTGSAFGGALTVTADNTFELKFKVDDFGGENNITNTTLGSVSIVAKESNTESDCSGCKN